MADEDKSAELKEIKNEIQQSSNLPEYSGILLPINAIENLTGYAIGISEYIALLIIDGISKTLGLDTQGKSLKDVLNMLLIAIDDPEMRDVLIKIMESLSSVLIIFIDELKAPLREVVDELIDLGGESAQKMAKTLVSASIDALGAVPIAGEIVEGFKLLDDVIKQIQASIGVVIKTGVLLTSFVETGLDSFTVIKKTIDDAISTINSVKQNIPTMENMKRKALERAGRSVKEIPQNVVPVSVGGYNNNNNNNSLQGTYLRGGLKKIRADINTRSKRIKKTLKNFFNRNINNNYNKINKTRRYIKN